MFMDERRFVAVAVNDQVNVNERRFMCKGHEERRCAPFR